MFHHYHYSPKRWIMTHAIEPSKSNVDAHKQAASKPQPLNAEIIRALTPIFLALIGGAIGMAVLVMDAGEAGFGLASTAIAGAAGLAQPQKEQNRKDE
jgi:hypothetical protein